jgi:hypothetical protein
MMMVVFRDGVVYYNEKHRDLYLKGGESPCPGDQSEKSGQASTLLLTTLIKDQKGSASSDASLFMALLAMHAANFGTSFINLITGYTLILASYL